MICRWSIPARWWCRDRALRGSSPPGRAPRSARIGKALRTLNPERPPAAAQRRRMIVDLALPGAGREHVLVVVLIGSRAAAGWMRCWPALPWPLPCCRRNSRWCSRFSSRWARGAFRSSKVLTRRMPALETLGAATVLCADKTGTITENRMTVTRLGVETSSYTVTGRGQRAAGSASTNWSSSACWRAWSTRSTRWRKPFAASPITRSPGTEHLHDDWTLVQQYPLSRTCSP